MRDTDRELVRGMGLFAGVAPVHFDDLMQASFLQRFPAGTQLITEGDPCDFLHVVVEGCAELYATAADRQTALALVEPVGTFILAAVIKDTYYLMSARTVTRSRILMIPASRVRAVFAADHDFARAVVTELASAFRTMVRLLKDQKLRTGAERLANALLRLHREQGSPKVLTLPIEKRMLASLLGMTPENLSRAFVALAPFGVSVDGPTITIKHAAKLAQFAKPTLLIDAKEP
jgi:CRP/FNR family transcriptional activator FtrB